MERCKGYMGRDNEVLPLSSTDRTEIYNIARQFSLQGQRVLAFASGTVWMLNS